MGGLTEGKAAPAKPNETGQYSTEASAVCTAKAFHIRLTEL